MAFADRDLVNTKDLGPRMTCTLDLLTHVLHLEGFDGFPIEKALLGYILDRRVPAASTNMKGEAFRVEWIVGRPVKSLLLHPLSAPAVEPTDIDLKVDTHTSGGEVSDSAQFAVVPPPLHTTPRPAVTGYKSGKSSNRPPTPTRRAEKNRAGAVANQSIAPEARGCSWSKY
jgi:hypothetical protein